MCGSYSINIVSILSMLFPDIENSISAIEVRICEIVLLSKPEFEKIIVFF